MDFSIYVITYILKLYEPTGVFVTEISLSTHPNADYISLILSVLEGKKTDDGHFRPKHVVLI
jgi:hypothetical protein